MLEEELGHNRPGYRADFVHCLSQQKLLLGRQKGRRDTLRLCRDSHDALVDTIEGQASLYMLVGSSPIVGKLFTRWRYLT